MTTAGRKLGTYHPTPPPNIAAQCRRRASISTGASTNIRLTISIGVSGYPEHGRDRTSLLDTADKAMYRAKSLGRNCVCSAAELAGPG